MARPLKEVILGIRKFLCCQNTSSRLLLVQAFKPGKYCIACNLKDQGYAKIRAQKTVCRFPIKCYRKNSIKRRGVVVNIVKVQIVTYVVYLLIK